MIQFAKAFPEEEIVVALLRQLSLSPCGESAGEAGIRVAEYFTELPAREILEDKLHTALAHARETLTLREEASAVEDLASGPQTQNRKTRGEA